MLAVSMPVIAQSYPTKPIRLIVPYPPGGNSDSVGRIVADRLGALLKTPLVVENKPGATTQIGIEYAQRAKADGYTLLLGGASSFTILPHLRAVPYDFNSGFDAVGGIADYLALLAVRKELPVSTLRELVDYARQHPGRLSWGSAGHASFGHIAGEVLKRSAAIDALHVPFKGSAPAATALLGAQVDFIIDGTALPLVKAGRITALASFGPQRHPELPDVPALPETGVKIDLPDTASSWGLLVPKGTPKAAIDRLAQALEQALAEPATQEKFIRVSTISAWKTAAQFRRSFEQAHTFYGGLIKSIGLKDAD